MASELKPEDLIVEAGQDGDGQPIIRLRLPESEAFDFSPAGAAILARRIVLAAESANTGVELPIDDGGAQETVSVESFRSATGVMGVEVVIVNWRLRFHPASAIRFAVRLRLAEMACQHETALRIEDGQLTDEIIEAATESMKLDCIESLCCGAPSNE